MEGLKFFFDPTTNISKDYERVMTKISNAKRASSTKLNALETYIQGWNRKNEDDIVSLQKSMVYKQDFNVF